MKKLMRKATKNYIVFGTLFTLGLVEAVSGFAIWLALPGGGGWHGGAVGLGLPSLLYQDILGSTFITG